MSLKANIRSRGASINLEFELDTNLLEQPTRLLDRFHSAFELARTAVDAELSGAKPLHRSLSEGPLFASCPSAIETTITD